MNIYEAVSRRPGLAKLLLIHLVKKCLAFSEIRGVAVVFTRVRRRTNPIPVKGKGLPKQAEVAQGVPGRLRPRIFLAISTTRVVGRQPYVSAAFTPGGMPGTHF